jgi:hypothetical protein
MRRRIKGDNIGISIFSLIDHRIIIADDDE